MHNTHTRTDGRQLQEKSNNQSATIGDFSVSLSVASGKRKETDSMTKVAQLTSLLVCQVACVNTWSTPR